MRIVSVRLGSGVAVALFGLLGVAFVSAHAPTTINIDNLQPSWTAPGAPGVWSAYYGPSDYAPASPGPTANYDGIAAAIIKAGLAPDPVDGHYWDEGLLAFLVPNVDVATFASQPLSFDVQKQSGPNPVWVRIRFVGGIQYQFVPTSNPAGWHTVDAAAGRWQLMDAGGNGVGPLLPLAGVALANPGALVERVYLTLGMGDSYNVTPAVANVSPSVGTVAWVDKVTIGDVTYDFVAPTSYVWNLQPDYAAVGAGQVYSSYYGPPGDPYLPASPGATADYSGRQAGIIKAGLNPDPGDGHYRDEGLFAFKPYHVTIDEFAARSVLYDVVNEAGTNPVWMTIEIDTGVTGVRDDNTTYQFVPTTNPPWWHTVDAAAGLWRKWNNNSGDVTGNPPIALSAVAAAHPGLNVVRGYLRLGIGDSYHGTGSGTIAWVSRATLGGLNYDFIVYNPDTEPPAVTVPGDMTVEATGPSGAVVTFSASALDDVDGAITPTCNPVSGSTFVLGPLGTSVTCSATDAAGHTGSASFLVRVVDTTAPTIDAHATVTAVATSAAGAAVTYTSPASHDAVSGNGTAACAPSSGSTFAIGTTTVTCDASDGAGNPSQRTFDVSVTEPRLQAGPANIWLGLKNSDDVGTKFDVLVEILKNGGVVGAGQANSVPGGSSGFNNAVLRTINLALSTPVDVFSGDTLSIRLSVRIAAGSGHRSGTARLWFNDAAAASRWEMLVGGVPLRLYLTSGWTLGAAPGTGPKSTVDVFVDRLVGGNPFKPFGTWSVRY